MTSAADTFVIALGRASKRANRHLRGLQAADRDDVTAAAIATCWEQRESFDAGKISLDDWFSQHVRNARRDFQRQYRHVSSADLAELVAPDDPAREAEVYEVAEVLADTLGSADKGAIAGMIMANYTVKEICAATGKSTPVVRAYIERLRRLRDMLPDEAQPRQYFPAKQEEGERGLAAIDHEIEKMLRRPKTERADCVVCWKCCYFLGLLPKRYSPDRIIEEEVRCAVHATEARKIEIAKGTGQ